MVSSSEFQSYLQEICHRYEQWWTKDALTETIAAQQATFSFEQIVQTQEPTDVPKEKAQIISLPIFKGIQNYIESEHILLVGSPGVGKSTTLLRCLVSFAKAELEKPEPRIPVLVPLKRYKVPVAGSEDSSGMLALIRDALKPQLRLRISDVEDLLFDKRLILLLDGLNEMPADSIRTHLKAFCEECKQSKIPLICTTRELGSGDLGITRRLEIQPLSPLEINRFLKECMPSQEQKVLQLLSRDNRELSRTPFVLWMLYHVFQETGTVAETLGEAFRKFFKSFKKFKEDAPVTDERRKEWNPWLEHLAFTMLNSLEPNDPGLIISDDRANKVLAEKFGYLHGGSSRIEELLKYHLLERVSDKEISFHHQLIQEYYAAEYLLTQLSELIKKEPSQNYNRFQREHLNYLKWTEAIALMLGLPEITEEQAIKIIELALNVDLKLGARLAGAVMFTWQDRTINIIADFNISPQIKAELLGITSSKFAIPKLSAITETLDIELRLTVIEAFGNIRSDQSICFLRKELSDNYYDIREKAIISLAKISSNRSIAEIAKLLDDPNTEIRRVAIYGLGTIGDKRVIPHLCKALSDSEAIICETAADALAKLGDEENIYCLIQSLDSLNSKLNQNLFNLLSSTNSIINYREICNFKNNSRLLLKVINDPIKDARQSIIEALYRIGAKETVELLKKEQYELAPYGKLIEAASSEIGNPILLRASSILESLDEDEFDFDEFDFEDESEKLNSDIELSQLLSQMRTAINENDIVMISATAYALGEEGCKKLLQQLVDALSNSTEIDISWAITDAIVRAGNCAISQRLWEIYLDKPSDPIKYAIASIQSRCQFYNYEIAQSKPPQKTEASKTHLQHDKLDIIIQGIEEVKKVSEEPKRVIHTQNYFEQGTHSHNHNYANDETLKQQIIELHQFVHQLHQTYQPTDEAKAVEIIDVEVRAIQKTNPTRWQKIKSQFQLLKSQLLNPESHFQATKATLAEVAKHYLEESVFSKAFITYIDTLSADGEQGE